MEVIYTTGCQQPSGSHSLSKMLPIYHVGGSYSRTGSKGLQMGTRINPFPCIRLDFRKSFPPLNSSIESPSLIIHSSTPLSCGLRSTLIRAQGIYEWNGPLLTVQQEIGHRLCSLQIGCSPKKSQVGPLTHLAGDESSAQLSDSKLVEEEATRGASRSSSRSSFMHPWLSRLAEVDWNKLILNCKKDEQMWSVPWTGQTVFQVMVMWFAAFWVVGSWILPKAAEIAGFTRNTLSFRGQALYSLVIDVAEGAVGIWILKRCLKEFLPLPEGWFPVKWQGSWLLEASWGCVLFPFVNRLSKLNLYLIPLPPLTTTYVEQSMMSRDPVATVIYAVVISVCAPIWEEVIFRGFLLPSMTRYMPLWGSILVSGVAFALAHVSTQRMLPLTFLGVVMGFVFVRSRNLLACIALHSLWNGFAFLELL